MYKFTILISSIVCIIMYFEKKFDGISQTASALLTHLWLKCLKNKYLEITSSSVENTNYFDKTAIL